MTNTRNEEFARYYPVILRASLTETMTVRTMLQIASTKTYLLRGFLSALCATSVCVMSVGCRTTQESDAWEVGVPYEVMPRELSKVVLPTYTIEPPDILTIDAVHVAPKAPYNLRTFDTLSIQASGTLPDAPILGIYPIEPGGLVQLGMPYGPVRVGGMTVPQAGAVIEEHLRHFLKEPFVAVTIAGMSAKQQIAGQHLVGPDGTVNLGTYGSVRVVGMSLVNAKRAIESHLSQFLEAPEVSLDVFAYNSKVYYIVTQGAGLGDGVFRFPITGNETVLDAISQINGLNQVASKRIWIARPTREPGQVQVLPVSWDAITAQASTHSNYQIFPGDRVFIAEDRLVAFSASLAKFTAPLEQIIGFSLLGTGGVSRFSGKVLQGGGNSNNNF